MANDIEALCRDMNNLLNGAIVGILIAIPLGAVMVIVEYGNHAVPSVESPTNATDVPNAPGQSAAPNDGPHRRT